MSDSEPAGEGHEEGFEPASRYLEAALVPRRGTWLAKGFRSLTTIVVGLLTLDLEAGPSVTDLRVTRRETGNEVLRVSAGTVSEADQLLLRVRRDLETKTVSAFVAEWRIVRPQHQDKDAPFD